MRIASILPLVVFAAFAGRAAAQVTSLNCDSRSVEETLTRFVEKKYGPTPMQNLQAAASGQQVPMKTTVTSMVTVGPLPDGQPGSVCRAEATYWRGDTGQTVSLTAEFVLEINPALGSARVGVTSMTP